MLKKPELGLGWN